jgi:lipopolysaccharide transport system permease protein
MRYRPRQMTAAITMVAGGSRSLDLTPDASFGARQAMAAMDVRDAVRLWPLCWKLSWLDIMLRYRGSTLGPFWLTLSTAVMVGALGVLNSALFGMTLRSYLPFLALSLVLWGFMNQLVTEGCAAFTSAEGTIRSLRMPFTSHAMRVVTRNLLVLAHNLVVIIVVDVALRSWPGFDGLLAIPAFLLWLLDGVAIALLLGAFCARFRDIPPIVGSVMQIAFFMSGVIYKPEQLGRHEWILSLNPFFSVLDIVRGPLNGTIPTTATYLSAIVYSVLLCGCSWLLFVRVRERISFWI